MWFLINRVLLTKDNLAKRKWTGCQKCCFCNHNETVDHMFLHCTFAKIVWWMIYFAYNIPPPSNVINMFCNWLNGVKQEDMTHIRIGILAICWYIWTSRNDIIFNKQKRTNFLQVILRAAQWIQLWAYIFSEDKWGIMDTGCSRLLKVTQDCYLDGVILAGFEMTSFLYFSSLAG
jgi:hypothetical protein